jgi:hypothetical protein
MRKRTIMKLVAIGFALSLVPLINGCSEEGTTSPSPIIQDTSPPSPPLGLNVNGGKMGVTLSWSPNLEADLAGYNAWIYDPAPGQVQSYRKLNDALITDLEYRCKDLPSPDPDYYFRLTAVDTYGNQSPMSALAAAEPGFTKGSR